MNVEGFISTQNVHICKVNLKYEATDVKKIRAEHVITSVQLSISLSICSSIHSPIPSSPEIFHIFKAQSLKISYCWSNLGNHLPASLNLIQVALLYVTKMPLKERSSCSQILAHYHTLQVSLPFEKETSCLNIRSLNSDLQKCKVHIKVKIQR